MLLILFAIFLGCFVTCMCFLKKHEWAHGGWATGIVFSAVATVVAFVMLLVAAVQVSSEKAFNRKIEIYQEENTRLEQSIDSIVQNYLRYETDLYEQFKNESSIVLIQMFPELQGKDLVMQQLAVLQGNNQDIKSLKSRIADLSTWKFWLYCGG